MAFREIDIRGLSLNPFTRFGDDWALVTAGDESGLNTMTVSWGQMGTLWGRPSRQASATRFRLSPRPWWPTRSIP